MEQKKNNKRLLWGLLAFVVIVAAVTTIYFVTKPKPVEGRKTITVTVVNGEDSKVFTIKTDGEYLSEALNQEKLIEGSDSEYGLFVESVNGVTANSSDNEFWLFQKDGEDLMTGVDSTVIQDGDTFTIILSKF